MTWVPSEKEIASVLTADTAHRYEYFIHRVCEAKAAWALYNDGWASVLDDDGTSLVPLWPHQAYAQAFAVGNWAGFTPRRIALDDLLGEWIPGMRRAELRPAVFPVPSGSAALVSLDDLEAHLRHELSEVYGVDD